MSHSFSRLTLGTVQFGLPYGIANQTGQVFRDHVRTMLALAHEHGINGLDTAASYGESESVLGWATGEIGLRGFFRLVTKVPQSPSIPAERRRRSMPLSRMPSRHR